MNAREKALDTAMKRHMGKLEEFSLLATAVSEWVVTLEQQHFNKARGVCWVCPMCRQ